MVEDQFDISAHMPLIALWRSDPLASSMLLGLIVFTLVVVILHFWQDSRRAPVLRYQNIVNTKDFTGSSDGAWLISGVGIIKPLVIQIRNVQTAVAIAANAVRGSVTLKQVGSRDHVEYKSNWLFNGNHKCDFAAEIHIESGNSAGFVFVFERLLNDKTVGWFVANDIISGATYKQLAAGEWVVSILIESTNAAPIELIGTFQISRDNQICLTKDKTRPCLRQRALYLRFLRSALRWI